jgi:hypothetical protein
MNSINPDRISTIPGVGTCFVVDSNPDHGEGDLRPLPPALAVLATYLDLIAIHRDFARLRDRRGVEFSPLNDLH